MHWVVQIMLTDHTWVLHGPFTWLSEANHYAAEYARRNPQVGTEVLGLHQPWDELRAGRYRGR